MDNHNGMWPVTLNVVMQSQWNVVSHNGMWSVTVDSFFAILLY